MRLDKTEKSPAYIGLLVFIRLIFPSAGSWTAVVMTLSWGDMCFASPIHPAAPGEEEAFCGKDRNMSMENYIVQQVLEQKRVK